DGRFVTAGEDAKIAVWRAGQTTPDTILSGHTAPIAALAVSADGRTIASAAWDRSVRLWHMSDASATLLEGHADNVNGVIFSDDGQQLISAGYDATLRIWQLDGGPAAIVQTASPINAVRLAGRDIVTAHADGSLRIHAPGGAHRADIAVGSTPLISLAVSPDGRTIATAGLRGSVAVIERATGAIKNLVGPALPVWALAFTPDGKTILAAGSDRLVRRWDAQTGEARDGTLVSVTDDILKKYANDPGAHVYRACVACHTLSPDDGNRAGPTLHRLFGRKIGTAPGYHYSDALRGMDIVWTPQTVARLFEIGPMAYTPGTKMPEQTLSSAQDRADLIAFLQKVQQDAP
ncbi:MAG: c-type cytochrome, partial [Beijerinckiaceae bacterium]